MVKFTGILVASVPLPACEIPAGFLPVEEPHITLLSSELGKDVRKILKGKDLSILPPFPAVTFGPAYSADNGTKASLVCDCVEQAEIRAWVESAIATLGIPVTLDPSRVYHVSVANRTGSKFDSVPDPWNHRNT
jgi:hypothetical protein